MDGLENHLQLSGSALVGRKDPRNAIIIRNIAPKVTWRMLRFLIRKVVPVMFVDMLSQENSCEGTAVAYLMQRCDIDIAIRAIDGLSLYGSNIKAEALCAVSNVDRQTAYTRNIEVHARSDFYSKPSRDFFAKSLLKKNEANRIEYSENMQLNDPPMCDSNPQEFDQVYSDLGLDFDAAPSCEKSQNELFMASTNSMDENNVKIIIENVNFGVSISMLYEHFKEIGEITNYGFYDELSVRKRKSAYILYKSWEYALKAICKFYGEIFVDEVILVSLKPESLLLEYLKLYENVTNYADITFELIDKLVDEKRNSNATDGYIENLLTVSNLPETVTMEDIEEHFSDADGIIDLKLNTDNSGRHIALLQYKTGVNIRLIKRVLDGTNLNGRRISIKL